MEHIFLKLSGEVLAGPKKAGSDKDTMKEVARQAKLSADAGIQVGTVIGGGSFWRDHISEAIDETEADQIGTLATVMSCAHVSKTLRNAGMMTQVLAPFVCGSMTKLFSKDRANKYFERSVVIFFAGRTSHPCFSADAGIALRAIEMEAGCILLARAIDRMYDGDPKLNPEAKKYGAISIQKVIDKQLAVVDLAVSIMCMEHKMPVAVFSLNEENGIADAIQGRINETIVTA